MAYKHDGFWQCMDTLRDKKRLEALWSSGNAPWKTWENKNENTGDWSQRVHRNTDDSNASRQRV